jgi:Histidine kinase
MKKYFLSSIIAILFSFGSFSQNRDLPTLESLKKQVPNLKDTALVNCLNLIAFNFSIIGFGPGSADFLRRSDSIFRYANLAFEAAKKINYKQGMVEALNQQASSENIKGYGLRWALKNDSSTTVARKNYLSVAIAIAKEINDDDALGKAYMGWPSHTNGDTIDYAKKSLPYFQKAGDEKMEGEVCTWIAEDYSYKGFYENAIEYCQRGLTLNRKTVNDARTREEREWREYLYQQSLSDMADLYKAAGDYQSSLDYLNLANQFGIERNTGWTMEGEKGEIFRLIGNYDSSFYYLRKPNNIVNEWTEREIAATYIMTKQYDSALAILKQIEPGFRKANMKGNLLPVLFYIGSAYAGKKEYNSALPYASEGISDAEYLGGRPDMMKGYELLSRIHHQLGNNDSAYYYLLKYNTIKDSIQSRQFLFRINNYKKSAEDEKKQSQLMLLDKDNKLKDAQLKQEVQQKNFLLILLSALGLAGFFVYRAISLKRKNEKIKHEQLQNEMKLQQLENEKKQSEFQRQTAELEMQALRAQMNPHFIFNCLSSINRFILKNESKTASNYLVRFSRLIRMVLINSQKPLVTLEDELQMLTIYLDMERLRFKDSFDYGITFLNTMETGNIFIPPLLLQPFCENAIWHGLQHLPGRQAGKEGQGRLNIEFSMKDNILNCTIADNGIGLEKSEDMKSKSAEREKSMGLKITTERLALLNRKKGVHSFYDIENIMDEKGNVAGTKINLKIGYKEREELLNT